MNDNDVLDAVRDSMAGVHMRTPVQKVVAAGRARRRRRIAGAAGGAALAAGLALTPVLDNPQVNAPPLASGNQVHVHLAAFSVDSNPDGTVTVKMTKRQSLDPATMERTLAQAGIPAQITINKWCEPSDHSQNLDKEFRKVLHDGRQPNGEPVMIFTPSAMPPATKLVIGMRTEDYQPESTSRVAVSMVLVPNDAPLTCSTDVPKGPPRDPRHGGKPTGKPDQADPNNDPKTDPKNDPDFTEKQKLKTEYKG
ncbi:hypothetical protein ABZU32_39310 [Sphaerisporangium sp. NPDC005288]|uniref:hypothetical protein n=1 Tax=Sphaerisporangium sp. NPDC005288 TaxID=3155114 RepID=UPI0033BF184A